MGDLLTAESLIFAIISALYGFWYEAIIQTADIEPADAKSIDVKDFYNVKTIYKKISGLTASLILISLIFIPDALRVVSKSLQFLFSAGISSYLVNYDAMSTAYFVILLLILRVTVYSVNLFFRNRTIYKIVEEKFRKSKQ